MRGHIQKRSNSYRIAVSAGFDPVTGKRRQIFRTVRGTKKDAERELTRVLGEIDSGSFADPAKETVAGYLDRYLQHAKTRVRERTWERYGQLIRRHIVPRVGVLPLAKLRPAHVQAAIDAMVSDGLAPRTVIQAYRVFSAAFRQAVRWEILAVNPVAAVRPPRADRPHLSVPDAKILHRIIAAALDTPLHAPIVLAATTGLRRGEVLGLRWCAIDLEAGLVRVTATLQRAIRSVSLEEPKTDRSRRTVALPPMTLEVLRKHKVEQAERRLLCGPAWYDADFVFDRGDGRPVDPDYLSRAFARIAARAGFPEVRLHDLRHAFATMLLAQGVHPKIASEALGHASVGFTMDVYSHVLPTMQEAAARAVQQALGRVGNSPPPP